MMGLTDQEIYRSFLDACAVQRLSLHVDPILEREEESARDDEPGIHFIFPPLAQPAFTGNVVGWRAYLVTARRSDGEVFVATGPSPGAAVRALWASFSCAREAYAELQWEGRDG